MAKMLVRNEFNRPETVDQVCSRCKEPVVWLKFDGLWGQYKPGTIDFHVCKEKPNGENTDR